MMSSLYDRMSPNDKWNYLKKQLIPSVILYLFCDFTNPPKPKYLVLTCRGKIPLFFIINSKISDFIKSRSLETTQMLVHASDYSFLDHDS